MRGIQLQDDMRGIQLQDDMRGIHFPTSFAYLSSYFDVIVSTTGL